MIKWKKILSIEFIEKKTCMSWYFEIFCYELRVFVLNKLRLVNPVVSVKV